MNEKKLVKFVEWLSTNIEEFKDKQPKEIVSELNKQSYTEEGVNLISGLISQFKESTQIYKNGGKTNKAVYYWESGTANVLPIIPVQNIPSGLKSLFFSPTYMNILDKNGKEAQIAQTQTKNGTRTQYIIRNNPPVRNETTRVIKNYGTPKADTIFYSPRGNKFKVSEAPTWNTKFEEIFTKYNFKKK